MLYDAQTPDTDRATATDQMEQRTWDLHVGASQGRRTEIGHSWEGPVSRTMSPPLGN